MPGRIIGVSIDGATNLAGFDLSRVTFDADNIWINMESLSANGAHRVVINVTFGHGRVPEPASLALAGLAGLSVGRAASGSPHFSRAQSSVPRGAIHSVGWPVTRAIASKCRS